jgi:hypothetical protein
MQFLKGRVPLQKPSIQLSKSILTLFLFLGMQVRHRLRLLRFSHLSDPNKVPPSHGMCEELLDVWVEYDADGRKKKSVNIIHNAQNV